MTYGIIGEKLGHSYSKIIHEELGAYSFELIPLSLEEIHPFMEARDFKGLCVTIPYKQTVMPYCDKISPLAKEIGAVNVLYFDEENKLCGTNTDYYGFIYAIESVGISLYDKKILIVGDGATSKTIRKAVLDQGADEIIMASRKVTAPVVQELVPPIGGPLEVISCTTVNYNDLHLYADVQVIINTTPVGMWPNTQASPLDLSKFPKCEGVFDVVYNPFYTQFLLQAKELNIPHVGGLPMLVSQATAASRYFLGEDRGFEKENQRIIEFLKLQI